MFEYYEDDHFEIPEKYLTMSREELHQERLRLYLEDAKAGKMRLHIGDRVIVDKNCFERYNDWTEDPCGTIIRTSTSAWDDIGGIYKLQLDNGENFNCSIEAIVKVVGWGMNKVIERPWEECYCDKCVHCVQDDMCSAYRLGMSWCYCPQLRNCTKFYERKSK